jgi:hypothetical protein
MCGGGCIAYSVPNILQTAPGLSALLLVGLQWLAWEVAMRQLLPPAYEDDSMSQQHAAADKQQDVRAVTV